MATGASKLSNFGSRAEWEAVYSFLDKRSAALYARHDAMVVFCPNYMFPQLREHLTAWRASQ